MAETRHMSPRARAYRRRGALGWGIGLLAFWALVTFPVTFSYSPLLEERVGMFLALQFFVGIFLIVGTILVLVGIAGERRATRFNTQDWALADSLSDALTELSARLEGAVHGPGADETRIDAARLIEIERHFDTQTGGMITGAMTHQLRTFGTFFSSSYGSARGGSVSSFGGGGFSGVIRGLTEVNLNVNSTTQSNLLGDALFSVFEAPGPAGERDTYRVISMSQPALAGWLQQLIGFASQEVGGSLTHAGATVLAWSGPLSGQAVSGDITYVTDRLKALHSRPYEQREPVSVRGMLVGRNAIIATTLTIAAGEELRLMPARFPEMFGDALARGIANGELRLSLNSGSR